MISIDEAKQIVEEAKEYSRSLGTGEKILVSYHNHVYGVASVAKLLAEKLKLEDSERVYVLGLLHDVGKVAEREKEVFHGVIGYKLLKDVDVEAANICLTHMFPLNQIEPYEQMEKYFYGKKKHYDLVKESLEENELTLIDRIIQFSDGAASGTEKENAYVTIEKRDEQLKNTRAIPEFALNNMKENKRFFDKALGYDVYELFKQVDTSYWISEDKKDSIAGVSIVDAFNRLNEQR